MLHHSNIISILTIKKVEKQIMTDVIQLHQFAENNLYQSQLCEE